MSIKSELLKNSVAFSMSCSRWGNLRRADKNEIDTDADKKMLRLSKKLVNSEEYENIVKLQNRARKYVEDRTVPSFFHRGVYLVSLKSIEKVENYLNEVKKTMGELVEEFLSQYRVQIIEARESLGSQFNENDYPSPEYLRNSFGISWKWVTFDVPENLPESIFKVEREKAEKAWEEASESIKQALRESFMKLISHAKEKLTPIPGEKQKIFRDSLIENIEDFLRTFNDRNIVNDTDLQGLVEKAKGILINPDNLRKDVSLRAKVAADFSEIEKNLDAMIITRPSRKFSFDD